jgi:hypothetical protein
MLPGLLFAQGEQATLTGTATASSRGNITDARRASERSNRWCATSASIW